MNPLGDGYFLNFAPSKSGMIETDEKLNNRIDDAKNILHLSSSWSARVYFS